MVGDNATRFERMLVTAARCISDGSVVFVGFHWPMLVSRVARRLHAPDIVVVYENGIVEDRLTPVLPTSPCDLVAAQGSPACLGSLEALYMWLGAGRVAMTILEAPIVDRYGNVNSTVVGRYAAPTVRLAGSGGGTELASLGRGLLLVSASTARRSFPERVDHITSPGYFDGRSRRADLGYKAGTGPQALVTPLGRFAFGEDGEMFADALHAGVGPAELSDCFSWPIRIRDGLSGVPEPSPAELAVVREELRAAAARHYSIPTA